MPATLDRWTGAGRFAGAARVANQFHLRLGDVDAIIEPQAVSDTSDRGGND